jgi:hypothetical protein
MLTPPETTVPAMVMRPLAWKRLVDCSPVVEICAPAATLSVQAVSVIEPKPLLAWSFAAAPTWSTWPASSIEPPLSAAAPSASSSAGRLSVPFTAVAWMSPPPQVPPLASICCTLRLPAAERNTSPPQLSVPMPAALIAALTTTSPFVPSMSGEPPLPSGPEAAFTGASTRVEPLAITVMSAPSPPWPVCPPPGPLRGPFSVMSCCAVIRTVPPLPLVPPPGTSISPSVTLPWLLSTSTSPPSKSPPVASSTPETLTAPTASRQIMPPAPWLPLLASSCPVIPIVLPAVTMMQPPSPSDVLACATTSPAIETAPPALSVMSPAPASPDTSIRPFAVPEICTAMSPLVLTVMSPPYPPVAERARS